jgi:hypothetical protein
MKKGTTEKVSKGKRKRDSPTAHGGTVVGPGSVHVGASSSQSRPALASSIPGPCVDGESSPQVETVGAPKADPGDSNSASSEQGDTSLTSRESNLRLANLHGGNHDEEGQGEEKTSAKKIRFRFRMNEIYSEAQWDQQGTCITIANRVITQLNLDLDNPLETMREQMISRDFRVQPSPKAANHSVISYNGLNRTNWGEVLFALD